MHRSGLTELEVVMAVVRRGSFRGAAQELGMSATAVSNAIAGLESRLETRLFNRTTRSVALTDAGQRYVARVGPALQEIRLAGEEIHSDTGEPAGTLRLNVPNHIGSLFLDQLLIDFMIRYPKMRVEIVSEARMIDIVAEGYDAGIRLEESIPQDMIAVPLTGRSASSSPPRQITSHVTAFRKRRTICCNIRGSACVWLTAGSTAGNWPVGGNVRACRAAALCDVRSFRLDPRRKSGVRRGIFAGTLYPGRA